MAEAPAPQGDDSEAVSAAEQDESKPRVAKEISPAAGLAPEMLDVEAESPILPASDEREES